MAIIANRVKTKYFSIELTRFFLYSLRKFCLIFMFCFCLYLLYSPSSRISSLSLETYGKILSAGSFVSDKLLRNINFLFEKLSYFRNLEEENKRLKLQISNMYNLQHLVDVTISENKELKKLLKVVKSPEYDYTTSRLLAVNITPFVASAVVEAGWNHNIKSDDLVVNHNALIGRIVNVSNNYSSMMLLNDAKSRVPVVTSSSREKAIVANQGNDTTLLYLPKDHDVKVGELLYSSGDGRVYPYGLLVGKVNRITDDGNVFVELEANLNKVEFVSIISKSKN